jgi:hypothetical protein
MCGNSQKRILLAGLFGFCGLAWLHSACAEPPREKFAAAAARESKGSHDAWASPAWSRALDLRPPSEIAARDELPGNEVEAAAGSRRPFRIEAFAGGSRQRSDSRNTAAGQGAPLMSPVENMAHNFRRQGLPVARLFQNGNLLVHLGLSPKGKPGLWFVRELH